MSIYNLVAFDMDGTLLNSKKEIEESSLIAIRKATEKGKTVCLSTGRNIQELESYLVQLKDIKYIISDSGALIYKMPERKPIREIKMAGESVIKLFEATKDLDIMWQTHSGDTMYIQEDQTLDIDRFKLGIYKGLFDKYCSKKDDLFEFYKQTKFPVYKFNFFAPCEEIRQELFRRLKDIPVETVPSENFSAECSEKGVSKGTGLKALCSYLNIPLSQTIAVGDGGNDFEIIKTAGLGVAMKNSSKELFEIAKAVTSSCDEDGCAKVIYDYLLKTE